MIKSKLLKLISVRLPEDLLQKIDARCEERSISRSSLFRSALEKQLDARAERSAVAGFIDNDN